METNHGSRIPDAKELPQPQGIETREVGQQRPRGSFVLGTPERMRIARAAHEANRSYCRLVLGDYSQPPFDEAPAWQVQSALAGIDAITLGEVKQPSDSHESWLRQKQAEGWVYGEVKNPATKEHPCMVPYEKLSPEQQVKDHIFFAIVTAMAGVR
jgi:hypothetical protein